MTAKSDAFADIEASYIAFRDQFALLGDEEYHELVEGDWNLAQILAHLAGWYRELAPELARIVAGEPSPEYAWSDADGWNNRFVEKAAYGMSALDDFDLGFHEFYAAAKATPEEAWGTGTDGAALPLEAFVRHLALGHTAKHQPAIEAWLSGRA
jgi:hypothetical protein